MSKTYMIRIDPDMTVTVKPYIDTLEALQEEVGGYIESVNLTYDHMMVVNENGKNVGLEENPLATSIYRYGELDHIVGPVVMLRRCRDYDEDGDPCEYWDGYSEANAKQLERLLKIRAEELRKEET